MYLPVYIEEILDTIHQAGYQAYVVGGCVRDALMGRLPHDYDVTTNAKPEQIEGLFEKSIPTGIQHGTITVLSESPVEITTFRQEKEYLDHRHPSSVEFVEDVKEDLARRDFTMNAIAYCHETGFIDPFGGQEDINNKVVRAVGNPYKRYEEDALRMLRAHRFAAQLDFVLEEETKKAIKELSHTISYVSIERVRSELVKILEANPLELYDMTELFLEWIPELHQSKGCAQNTPWHCYDVLMHTLQAIRYLQPFDETTAYTLLFHDLAKPACKKTINGRDRFWNHPKEGEEIAKRLVKVLKLTKEQQRIIPLLVRLHDEHTPCKLKIIYKYRVKYGLSDEELCRLIEVRKCDISAHSPKGRTTIMEVNDFEVFYHVEKRKRPLSIKQLCVSGKDLIERLNIQGADIRTALESCLEYCFYHPEKNTVEDCIAFLQQQ
ncbi:MAG: CCA tRNA nucleotidyltransferase [Bacillota bacterium]|nr:CCA tRNA nucleotidyltransferase [Bacillota bacterium]